MGYDMDTKAGQEISPEEIPEFKNIFIENIVCNGAKKPISISGLKAMPIHHVYLKNISVQTKGSVKIENAENIFQENINILEKH